jgi:hypothetical protein
LPDEKVVTLNLPLETAENLHAALEGLLETDRADPALQKAYRILAWRILAARGGTGLTATMAAIAREANTVEEYEAARDRALSPILGALESPENRDP